MPAFCNLTIAGKMSCGYAEPIKFAAYKEKSYALEKIAAEGVTSGADLKHISVAEAGIQPADQDRLEKSVFDPRHIISNLFGEYSEKLYAVDFSYEKPALPIINNVRWGIEQKGFNEKSIAQIAAEVGKHIDHLHNCGYYTDYEYGQLNEEIKYGTRQWVDELYECRTTIRLSKERARAQQEIGLAALIEDRARMSQEHHMLERIRTKQKILKENPPDFDGLFALIEKLRNARKTKIET